MVGTLSDRLYCCHENFKKETFCFNTEKSIAADDKKNIVKELDNIKNNAILGGIGLGTPVSKAAACHRQGGELLNNNFAVSLNIEPAGRTLCGVTLDTCSNPAGSFFVPDLELREKSDIKNLIQRRCRKMTTQNLAALPAAVSGSLEKRKLDISQNNAILNDIGCESLIQRAAACHRQGGNLLNNIFTGSVFFEPVGRYICTGVTLCTSLTPAGSFFVPDVRVRGKILAQNPVKEKVCYDKR